MPAALVAAGCAAASVAILAAKFFLAARINVNWDEFYFLSHVHDLARGELALFLQGAYTHVFRWLASTGGDEMDQVLYGRLVMCALLAVAGVFTYALARLWVSRAAAAFAAMAVLVSWPVLKHGASFRADSILLPLTLAAFWFALRGGRAGHRDAVVAGVMLGVAFVVTVKAVLLLPALVLMMALPDARRVMAGWQSLRTDAARIALMLASAAVVSAALLWLHATQVVAVSEPAGEFALRTLAVSVLETPFMTRRDHFADLIGEDPVYWIAVLVGVLVAVRKRAFGAAAAVLCFVPLLFYRNAFAYFFPVMMAPAAVLVAISLDWLLGVKHPRARGAALAAIAVAGFLLFQNAWRGVATLRFDEQAGERAVVAAVHRVFAQPVPYIDHSGMIASFPKANFFMSSWGVERYLRMGEDFMPRALNGRCPPLLLVNHAVLSPGSLLYRQLRPTDRALLESSYMPYWGPLRVAGTAAVVAHGDSPSIRVPCSGRYRAVSSGGFQLNGRPVADGDVIELDASRSYQLEATDAASDPVSVRLLWADARDPPEEPPPRMPIYSPL